MALLFYEKQGANKKLLAVLDYEVADVSHVIEYVKKKTGLVIDCYGDTRLYPSHLIALKSASKPFAEKGNTKVGDFYKALCSISLDDFPAGISYVLIGD